MALYLLGFYYLTTRRISKMWWWWRGCDCVTPAECRRQRYTYLLRIYKHTPSLFDSTFARIKQLPFFSSCTVSPRYFYPHVIYPVSGYQIGSFVLYIIHVITGHLTRNEQKTSVYVYILYTTIMCLQKGCSSFFFIIIYLFPSAWCMFYIFNENSGTIKS